MIQYLAGRTRKLVLPNGEEHKAIYAIVDLNDIKASHNEITFGNTINYPLDASGRNINDRNYKEDIAAQRNVQKIAENLNPESLISLSSTPAGTPIINKDGIVVSGNNRVMSLKLAVAEYPENYEQYKQQLAEDIEAFGFDYKFLGSALLMNDRISLPGSSFNNPLSIKFTHPVLVRIDESLPEKLTTETLAAFNQDSKKGERPVDKAIKLASILNNNERCRTAILNIIDGYETFSDLYSPIGRLDRKKLMDNFVQCGLIPEAQLPSYFDNGEFTETGKDYIETLLSAIILTPDAIKVSSAEGVKKYRQTIISSLPVLITNENLKEGSLKNAISDAIIVQYKITQIGDFSDYTRSQSLFSEDKPTQQALYLNALLRAGRNTFKNAIKRYTDAVRENSGPSLFGGEQLTIPQIFDATIIASIDATDKKVIEQLYPVSKTENMQQNISSADVAVIDSNNLEPETAINESWFMGDNWFKQHPEKILGEAYETSGRFGTVTKYKGTIEAVSRIDAPLDFIGNMIVENNPLISTGENVNLSAELQKTENEIFVNNIIEKANQQIGAKISRKKKEKVVDEDQVVNDSIPLQTFEDVYRTYNKGITEEETQVFIWYKTQIGKPLSRRWINLIHRNEFTENLHQTQRYNVDDATIKSWVNQGLVYYYQGQLIPSAIYLSGNMYDKKMQLDTDKETIIAQYGEEVYNNQVANFDNAWKTIYDKRLTIGQTDESLVVLPISKLSREFKIERIAEMPETAQFKISKITAASNPNYGKPDWEKDPQVYSDYKKEVFEHLSLTEAYNYWLMRYKPELKQPITHYEIVKYYCYGSPIRINAVNDTKAAQDAATAKKEKLRSAVQIEGERLFKIFLDTQLEANDKVRLETEWNSTYNNYLPIDFNRIPVAFTMCRYYKGGFEQLKPEKREAVAFVMNEGSGCLSYDVGVGKTPSAIFTLSAVLDAGYAKRPLIVVPNQVYKQFIAEIKSFAPHIAIMEGYNLSDEYVENFKDANNNLSVSAGTVTIMTYEGLERIGFSETTQNNLLSGLYEILNQGGESERQKSEKQKASFQERLETLVGRGLSGTTFNIEDFGFDFICYDEAHKMKKVFTAVKGDTVEIDGKKEKQKNPYVINSGTPSSIALKGFMLNYYVQQKNNGQNILMLTATPFTNSPLEIFSMLSMIGYDALKSTDLNNIKNFFDTYVKTSTELVINTQLKPQFKQVILGFNNLVSLQTLIRRFINYKTGEDVKVPRPKKYVLPYLTKIEDGMITRLDEDEKVETYIPMTPLQTSFMNDILAFVEGKANINDATVFAADENEDEIKDTESVVINESFLSDKEKQGVRIIKGLTYARNLALSPYLYVNSGLGKPNYKNYVETSPKLQYVMGCIKSVKQWHESHNQPVSGQVIYMDRGIEYFPLLKEYLIKQIGFKEHEVGIIQSGLPKNGKRSKEYIKNLFNGEMYNEETKLFDAVPDEQRIKVIIGSSTIKEGINLQKYGTVLYNCFIDWNPTDIQQLEGRIYRQGNTFNSVRIVNPLVIDSADIFLFQKLQEKTSRLNTIWATDGKKNVLNTEEFNPEELKYALIRDPKVIAELKSIEAKSKIESDVIGYKRQLEIIDKVKQNVAEVNRNFKNAVETISKYRNFTPTDNQLNDALQLGKLNADLIKNQKDKDGRKMVASYIRDTKRRIMESTTDYEKRMKEIEKENYSPLDPYYPPYWFSDFALAARDVNRAVKEFIAPNNIPFSLDNITALDDFKKQVEEQITKADETKQYLSSDAYKKQIEKEVIEDRENNKITYKTVPENIQSFAKMNYLLADKKVKIKKAITAASCPPLANDGLPAIDDESLRTLDECISHEGQTKDKYTENGIYTAQRIQLHEEIINDLFKEVKCVKRGEQPIAVFTGGSPASGKSTYIKKIADYLLTPDVFHLDADEIRAKLPEYKGWNASATHKETQDIVNGILENIGDGSCRYDFVYDGTMNKAQKYFPLINKVKDMGYKTFIIFMDIPYGVARNRALQRYRKGGKDGLHRYVPMEVIDDFFKVLPNGKTMGESALNELKQIVDGYIVIDGVTGKIVEEGGEKLPQERFYEGIALAENMPLPKDVEIIAPAAQQRIVPVQPVLSEVEVSHTSTEQKILSSKEEQFEMPHAINMKQVNENVNYILSIYAHRKMAALQVQEYITEINELGKEWLTSKGIKNKEQFDKYVANQQSKMRQGKGIEKSVTKKEVEKIKAQANVDAITSLALNAYDNYEKEIEKQEKQQKTVEPNQKNVIQKQINALTLANKYAAGKAEKEKIQKQIKALQTALKYI